MLTKRLIYKRRRGTVSCWRIALIFVGAAAWVWALSWPWRFWRLERSGAAVLAVHDALPQYQNLWRPQISGDYNLTAIDLQQDVKAAVSADFASGRVFYARNIYERRPLASLTKLMTAAITLDHAPLEKKIVVPAAALDIPEDSSFMGLDAGEIYTVEDLLYGLLLPSGNDAANALALELAGSTDTFVYWMNRKAAALGLKDTHFANPSGLDAPDNYSTVYDLAVLTHYVLSNYPTINKIVGERQYEIAATDEHKYSFFGNFNDLMLVYEGVDGVKPGNTGEAGSCLTATATRNNRRMLAIVLGATYRNAAAIKLLDLAFDSSGQ